MSTVNAEFKTCDACGATIYPEHLENHTAERYAGKLLCPHCLAEKRPTAVTSAPGHDPAFRRPLMKDATTATRCRTFHAKLADGALAHLDEQINLWVDSREDVQIKFATSTIGVVEGKHSDPHLIVTIFY